jgi:hypothetical protein
VVWVALDRGRLMLPSRPSELMLVAIGALGEYEWAGDGRPKSDSWEAPPREASLASDPLAGGNLGRPPGIPTFLIASSTAFSSLSSRQNEKSRCMRSIHAGSTLAGSGKTGPSTTWEAGGLREHQPCRITGMGMLPSMGTMGKLRTPWGISLLGHGIRIK